MITKRAILTLGLGVLLLQAAPEIRAACNTAAGIEYELDVDVTGPQYVSSNCYVTFTGTVHSLPAVATALAYWTWSGAASGESLPCSALSGTTTFTTHFTSTGAKQLTAKARVVDEGTCDKSDTIDFIVADLLTFSIKNKECSCPNPLEITTPSTDVLDLMQKGVDAGAKVRGALKATWTPSSVPGWCFAWQFPNTSTRWTDALGDFPAHGSYTNVQWIRGGGSDALRLDDPIYAWVDCNSNRVRESCETRLELKSEVAFFKGLTLDFSTNVETYGSSCVLTPGRSVTARMAVRQPTSRTLVWSIEEINSFSGTAPVILREYASTNALIDGSSVELNEWTIKAADNTGDGWFILRGRDKKHECVFEEVLVMVGCPSCAGGGADCSLGVFRPGLGSVDAGISLGRMDGGGSAGELRIFAGEMTRDLFTPKGLQPSHRRMALGDDGKYRMISTGDNKGMESVVDADGRLQDLKVPEGLVRLDPIVDGESYSIKFYDRALVGDKDEDGRYTVTDANAWHVKYTIANPDAGESFTNRLRITKETTNSEAQVFEYEHDSGANKWTLRSGNGLKTETVTGTDTKTRDLMDGASTLVSRSVEMQADLGWGNTVTQQFIYADAAGAVKLGTSWEYYTNKTEASYANLKQVTGPGNEWTHYQYDSNGRQYIVSRPFAGTTGVIETVYDYTLHTNEIAGYEPGEPRTVVERTLGVTTRVDYAAFITNSLGERVEVSERAISATEPFGSTNNLRSETTYYAAGNTNGYAVGRVKNRLSSDGRFETYVYAMGTFVPADRSFTEGEGSDVRTIVTHGTAASPNGIAGKTTRSVSVADRFGRSLYTAEEVCTDASGNGTYALLNWSQNYLDAFGRATNTLASTGSRTESIWGCCGKEWEKDANGIEYSYSFDNLDRQDITTKQATNPIITTRRFNAAGQVLTNIVSAGGLIQTSSNAYDLAGRQIWSRDTANILTEYGYSADGLTVTNIQAGLTNVTVSLAGGRIAYTEQNGVRKATYSYGVNEDGSQWTITYTGPAGTDSPMWQKTTTDLLGRPIRTEQPGYGGAVATTLSFFDSKNHLRESAFICGSISNLTLFEYNEIGEQVRSGLDVNNNGTLDLASMDRISESSNYYENAGGDWFQVSVSALYSKDNDATLTTNSIQKTKLTGLGAGGLASYAVSADILGNQTISTTTIDRDNKTVTQVVDYPDSTNDAVSVSINGLMVSSKSKTGVEYLYGHDALERQISITDPRTGTSVTHFNDKGQVDWVEDAASNRTDFAYEESSGRRVSTTDALTNTIYTAYSAEGQVIGTWGATYPVFYEFDDFNRMAAMYTLRDTNVVVTNYSSFAAQPSAFDKTTWLYDQATGLLTNKLYADTNGVSYTYTGDGKLATRAWARGIVTTYRYEPNSGAMTNIDYSDSTPDVYFTLDRIGRQKTIQDGQGMRSFTYNDALQLASETNALGLITRNYDSQGRNSGFTFGAGYSVGYGFDGLGRFSSVTSAVVGVNRRFDYFYLANSDLISGWSNDVTQVSRAYEAHRNLLTQVKTMAGTNLISQFDYSNDALGRRTQRIDGRANPPGEPSVTNLFGYNPRSELVSALMGTNGFGYSYDPIGNRLSASNNAEVLTYLANALNQYTNIADGVTNVPTYDLDGNMLTCGAWTFGWDGENRLILASNGSTVVTCAYDYMGRRYQKVSGSVTNTFIFDGWAMIQESSSSGVINAYVYGLDLSGSLQGAGTIGGILVARLNGTNAFYAYDGNGNVTDLTATNGTVVGHYEYDPYGNTLVKTGSLADANPFRFSTKYTDDSTGLLYYGSRFYNPGIGRWLSRDPIEEEGGINVYVMCDNDPIQRIDLLGQLSATAHHKGLAMLNGSHSFDKKFSYHFVIQYKHTFANNQPHYILAKLKWHIIYHITGGVEKESTWEYQEWFWLRLGTGNDYATPISVPTGSAIPVYDTQKISPIDDVCRGDVTVSGEYGVAKGINSDNAGTPPYFGIVPSTLSGSGDMYDTWKSGNSSDIHGPAVSFDGATKTWEYTYKYRNGWRRTCCQNEKVDGVTFK